MTGTEPSWLPAWRTRPIGTPEALARFDGLPSPDVEEMTGRWRGATLPTGHPLDGLLEALGWYGKAVESPDRVHPLLFRRPSGEIMPLEPALMPAGIALRAPGLARSRPGRMAFAALWPALRARGPAAKLGLREVRGRRGTALIYNRQPIVDHLRRAGEGLVIGMMERKGMARPFFFLLERDTGTKEQAP